MYWGMYAAINSVDSAISVVLMAGIFTSVGAIEDYGIEGVKVKDDLKDYQEYAIAAVSKNLPQSLAEELLDYIDTAGLQDLKRLNVLLREGGQLQQLVVLSEYSILQFGILLTVLKDQDLVLADDARNALAMVADILRTLSGHMELLLAPEIKH